MSPDVSQTKLEVWSSFWLEKGGMRKSLWKTQGRCFGGFAISVRKTEEKIGISYPDVNAIYL